MWIDISKPSSKKMHSTKSIDCKWSAILSWPQYVDWCYILFIISAHKPNQIRTRSREGKNKIKWYEISKKQNNCYVPWKCGLIGKLLEMIIPILVFISDHLKALLQFATLFICKFHSIGVSSHSQTTMFQVCRNVHNSFMLVSSL